MLDKESRNKLRDRLRGITQKAASKVTTEVKAHKGDFKIVLSSKSIDHYYQDQKIAELKIAEMDEELIDLVDRIQDFWCEEGKSRERIGEFIERIGLGNFLEEIEVEPIPEMVKHPRENPYVFYEEYFEEGDDDEEEDE